jgi:uncharacterized integral membrane protein
MSTEQERRTTLDTETGGDVARRRGKSPAKRDSRAIAAALLGALVAVFAVLNLDKVDVNWALGTWRTPLILVIAVSVAAGFVLGWFFARGRAKRKD